MNTPKHPRLSILATTRSGHESPLLRRSVLNTPNSSNTINVTNPNLSRIQAQNDDEDERRRSRTFNTSITESDTSTNLNEAADSLNNCLKLFAENKINKDNAWSLNIIDSFAKLITKHHNLLSNFQVAGTTLEASAKVYGLRVDSVYNDVCRMSQDLARQTAKALTKKKRDDDEEEDFENNTAEKENLNASNQPKEQPKIKKTRKKKNVSTITKNPECLNARLDTIPLTDPFFAKLNSVIGDTTSSKRLMQNIIPTEDAKLKLRQNIPFWNSKDQPNIDFEQPIRFSTSDPLRPIIDVCLPNYRIENVAPLVIRSGLSNYQISNLPLENNEDSDLSQSRYNDMLNSTTHNHSTHMELAFDINAAVEPVSLERSVVMDYGDMDQGDFEDLNEMDMVAVDRCKGLKRQPIVIEDMQPETATSLEYSYRPLDMFDQFWAGPSHWKVRQSRRTQMSMGIRASCFKGRNTEQCVTDAQQKKVTRKRKIVKTMEVTFEDIRNFNDVTNELIEIKSKMKKSQLTTAALIKKFDPKKFKLPLDYKIPFDIFDKLNHATSLQINSNRDVTFTGNDDGSPHYDYNNENDRNYCSRLADIQSDTETETNTDMGQMDNNLEFDNVDMPPPTAPVDEISDVFVGAPQKIDKIDIAFARRAKVIDMKQLKACTWSLLNNKHNLDPTHNPKFSETVKELPKVLSRNMAENMSTSLAFYATLHLCNDKGLELHQPEYNLRDFEIEFAS
ncbi:CLUMA_CG012995, isoform A [Clunio marinus]|uniref:Condensin complex subunit 2 n=1 Tax=Clunio marinus TaxID=568069 RepID=A0A1J1IHI9_9DIPT|nr:CLUMA_CG012995, isoform A [Clunio marinus]